MGKEIVFKPVAHIAIPGMSTRLIEYEEVLPSDGTREILPRHIAEMLRVF